MSATPDAAPSPLIAKLARPSAAYKRRAWLAVAGLALFMLLYFALAAWFGLTAWRLTVGAGSGSRDALFGWIVGGCAAFLAVFMLKAVFFVKHGGGSGDLEITPQQQPELFAFLHRLADKAGAPRPHKVFLSPRVNASVFYDLSILNLFLPAKKNLEIGLGLVNTLTLGEFRAVLAHEFGHFAQRAMAVGRWVYITQQIAAALVARRDKLDDLLNALSRFDVRIAWVGWVLRLIVWSIRSLVDSVFRGVLLMQRALSREMELNADLVAVSLTGSDALIHALHKLEAADESWSRAAAFAFGELRQGCVVGDVFAVQAQVITQTAQLLGDPAYGRSPAPPASEPAAHRVFRAVLAQPPQMWLTHPLNHEREANAKRHYIAAPIDDRPAWTLFAQPQALREAVTARLLGTLPEGAQPHADPLGALARQYERECFASRYRGVYLGRSIVRAAATPAALVGEAPAVSAAAFEALYPATLADDMERLRTLEKERAQLRGLQLGSVQAPDGVIRHRGQVIERRALPATVQQVERELAEVNQRLQVHDRLVRSLHLAAAKQAGAGHADYLAGLLAALHFADHTEDDLRDLQGLLNNTIAIATATRKVDKKGIERIVRDGNALRDALAKVHADAPQVRLDAALLQRLGTGGWAEALGELTLPPVSRDNVSEWLNAVDSWVDHTAGACGALRSHALELLLVHEAAIAAHVVQGTPLPEAPAPASVVPAGYVTLPPGGERPRQTQLDWWGRFQTASGWAPAGARLAVAGGIVAAVLTLGASVGTASVTVYNGLARPVKVSLGTHSPLTIAPLQFASVDVEPQRALHIEARSTDGQLIDTLDATPDGAFGRFVYNVGGAVPLVEWTATYGNASAAPERTLGAPRWASTSAEVMFTDPPQSISTKGGGGTRTVISAPGDATPGQQLSVVHDPAEERRIALLHARWDAPNSAHLAEWLWIASREDGFAPVLQARLAEAPEDVLLRRMAQDTASPEARATLCAGDQQRAAAAPDNADLAYIATRCLPEGAAKDRAFVDGYTRHPQHGWFAYAAAYVAAGQAQWTQALGAAEVARRAVPALADPLGVDMARMRRMVYHDSGTTPALLSGSVSLRAYVSLESPAGNEAPARRAYLELAKGHLDAAVQLARSQPRSEARLVRLAAASQGASPALVARALALPAEQGLDVSNAWAAYGLALRAGQDTAAFAKVMRVGAERHADPLLRFAALVQRGGAPAQAEALLDGVPPEVRGQAYGLGVMLLGDKAPATWREGARRLLFPAERPYLG